MATYDPKKQSIVSHSENDCSHPASNKTNTSLVLNKDSHKLLDMQKQMCNKLDNIKLEQFISYVYNPLKYARNLHEAFVNKYFNECSKTILFLGMNPGPWGMCQTGIVFGERECVREWMQLSGSVEKPEREHPKKKIAGLDCHRNEISGKKFWGLFKDLCGCPENFFRHSFVYNHCCLAFMDATGKNITPPEIKDPNVKKRLNDICNETLVNIIREFKFDIVIGIGIFAAKCAITALRKEGLDNVKVFSIPHPSPRSAKYFKNWEEITLKKLQQHDLLKYFVNDGKAEVTSRYFRGGT